MFLCAWPVLEKHYILLSISTDLMFGKALFTRRVLDGFSGNNCSLVFDPAVDGVLDCSDANMQFP